MLKDLSYALRSLRRTPVFTCAAVLSLALGIGGNTAIFSLIDQVLLRSLPIKNPEQLVIVKSPGPRNGRVTSDEPGGLGSFSYPIYQELHEKVSGVADLFARFAFDTSIAFNGQTSRGHGELVSGNYFDVLGVKPRIGRLLTPEDDAAPGTSTVVVLGHAFWQNHFSGRTDVLNQPIVVNGRPMTIVGVTPPGFFGVQKGFDPDVFIAITMKAQMTPNWDGLDSHRDYWLNILGRIKPGFTLVQAQSQLTSMYKTMMQAEADQLNLRAERRDRWVAKPIVLDPGISGRQILSTDTRQPLLVLMVMVGLVLLIACVNVANLLVARATARERETAVRLAIGASRLRLVRQCLVESLVLAAAGAFIGLLVSYWTINGLLQIMPSDSGVRLLSAAIDARVLLFASALSVVTGIGFGLLPALESTRSDIANGLKSGTASSSTARHARMRKMLVVAQVTFTLLMIVGAGLFAKTLLKLNSVDIGLKTERIIRFGLAPDLNGYNSERARALYERLQAELKTIPGISSVALAEIPVFADSDSGANVTIEGYNAAESEDMDLAQNQISPAYFTTLGIPLLKGREFGDADTLGAPKVCMINEATADRFFKDREPIGSRIAFGAGNRVVPDMMIVGVVKNSKHSRVGEEQRRFIYTPYFQKKDLNQITFYVSTAVEPTTIMNVIRNKVREQDASLPVADMKTLETQISESLYAERLMVTLSIAFGVLSVLLAGFGIYGVMSYLVSRRTREIGIRMAVGASASSVRWMIAREILSMTVGGVVLGLPLAYFLGRAARALLYGMTGADLQVTSIAVAAVGLLALAAAYFPARRAVRINPVSALRNE